jgi:hypothetical protein
MQDPISKITREKRAGGIVQMVECWPSQCEALSLNFNIREREREKKIQKASEHIKRNLSSHLRGEVQITAVSILL